MADTYYTYILTPRREYIERVEARGGLDILVESQAVLGLLTDTRFTGITESLQSFSFDRTPPRIIFTSSKALPSSIREFLETNSVVANYKITLRRTKAAK